MALVVVVASQKKNKTKKNGNYLSELLHPDILKVRVGKIAKEKILLRKVKCATLCVQAYIYTYLYVGWGVYFYLV